MTTTLNLSKLFKRLEEARAEEKYYEVLQIYKTIYFRCIKARRYSAAVEYLFEGSQLLNSKEQWNDAADLVKLLIHLLRDEKVSLATESSTVMPYLKSIFSNMKPGSVERGIYLSDVMELMQKQVPHLLPEFHEHVGKQLWCEKRHSAARPHLLCSNNGQTIGQFLVEFHVQFGYPSEVDLFITQSVLQCLCMQKMSVATWAFYIYTRFHPQLTVDPSNTQPSSVLSDSSSSRRSPLGPPYESFPLLNFIWFLLISIKCHLGLPVFHELCEKYAGCIERDPVYPTYLQRIAVLYFGLQPPPSAAQPPNMLMNLFRLFEDDSSSSANEPTTSGGGFPSIEEMLREIREDDMD